MFHIKTIHVSYMNDNVSLFDRFENLLRQEVRDQLSNHADGQCWHGLCFILITG